MADAAAEYRRVQTAYEQATLTLISRPTSPAILTIFRLMFSTEKPTVPTARMHDQVDLLLQDLRRADLPNVPTTNGRDSCLKWMSDGWLLRMPDDDGNEVYSLTSSAWDGLRTVERLTRDRSIALSGHLIAGLVRHLRDFAATVSPDVAAYVTNLQQQKAELQAEIDRVVDGGALREATDDVIIQGVLELQRYLVELPGDFTRVVESYRDFERQTISEFRHEAVTSGEAVRRYLDHAERIKTASAAGRGFQGALELIADTEMLDQVNRYITTLLDSPRANALLAAEDRSQIRNAVILIRDGLHRVIEQRKKVTRTLHDYISSHDVERDHQLAATLRELEVELQTWMGTAGPRAKAPHPLLPGRPAIAHLKTKMHDPADDEPPPPLADLEAPAEVGGLTLAELRARGGPSHAALHDELAAKFEAAGGVASLADLFHNLPPDLRRPVEILGVLPLARRSGLRPTGSTEIFETIRPDGSRRVFNVPRYAHEPDSTDTSSPGDPRPSHEAGAAADPADAPHIPHDPTSQEQDR